MSGTPDGMSYFAALWEHPSLCVSIFGVQFHSEEGQKLYEGEGMEQQVFAAMEEAKHYGLLLNRPMMSPEGPLLLQYWRSYEDLDRWARKQPHSEWWTWLMDNAGKGVGFYHEIYQVKTAEAIYEAGTTPVGPALFSSVQPVERGKGQSRQRQQQFAKTQDSEVG
jgi:hypothetical protein